MESVREGGGAPEPRQAQGAPAGLEPQLGPSSLRPGRCPQRRGLGEFPDWGMAYLDCVGQFLCEQPLQLALDEGVKMPHPHGVLVKDIDDALEMVLQLSHLPDVTLTFRRQGLSGPGPPHPHISSLLFLHHSLDRDNFPHICSVSSLLGV